MTHLRNLGPVPRRLLASAAGAVVLLGTLSGAAAATGNIHQPIIACSVTKTGAVRIMSSRDIACRASERRLTWDSALPGAAGATGSVGPAGAKGDTGAQGDAGLQGANGPAGPAGAKGDTGAAGDVGLPGANGNTGAQGANGNTGAQGANGNTGAQGAPGATGAQGPGGVQGAQGPAGPGSVGSVYTVPAGGSGGYLQLVTAGSDYELDLTCNYGAAGDNETFWFADRSSHSASVVETFIGGGVGGVYDFSTVTYGQGGTNRVNPGSWPYQATFTINEDGNVLTRWDVTATGSSGGACTYTVYQNGSGSGTVRP